MNRNQKYWLLGLIGCAMFGVGDWLLGYVDPQPVSDAFTVLKPGHGAGYALWKMSNGIDTFCMNAGMMIWFSYLLAQKRM